MTKIGFVRHGITAWNVERRAQGSSDIPLNKEGLLEAESVAIRLGKEDWNVIYSSDLSRASQTAQAIKEQFDDIPLHLDARLQEVGGGKIEGTTEEERVAKWGSDWRELELDMETAESIRARGLSVWNDIIHKHPGENILIVSHGSFIKRLLRELLPNEDVEESLKNCSLTTLQKSDDGWGMELHNCTRHMAGVPR